MYPKTQKHDAQPRKQYGAVILRLMYRYRIAGGPQDFGEEVGYKEGRYNDR